MAAELIDGMVQALFTSMLHLELLAFGQAAQVIDQYPPLDQKGPTGLVAAETVKQFDRPPAPQAKQALDHGTVHYRHIECLQHGDDLRNMQQPQGFGGHRDRPPFPDYVAAQLCHGREFLAYDNRLINH